MLQHQHLVFASLKCILISEAESLTKRAQGERTRKSADLPHLAGIDEAAWLRSCSSMFPGRAKASNRCSPNSPPKGMTQSRRNQAILMVFWQCAWRKLAAWVRNSKQQSLGWCFTLNHLKPYWCLPRISARGVVVQLGLVCFSLPSCLFFLSFCSFLCLMIPSFLPSSLLLSSANSRINGVNEPFPRNAP